MFERHKPEQARGGPLCRLAGLVVAIAVALAGIGSAVAGVNLKNGNFYISYTDIVIGAAKFKIEITRTYNSKSTGMGLFGFGWGSDYETALQLGSDGRITIREHGQGGKTFFERAGFNEAEMLKRQAAVADQLKRTSGVASPEMLDRFTSEMGANRELALARFDALSSVVTSPPLNELAPVGVEFISNDRGVQTIVRDESGYTRNQSGQIDRFDLAGRLVFTSKSGMSLRIIRDAEGRILRMTTGEGGETLSFDYNGAGQLTRIRDPASGKSADYRYDGDDLVWSRDSGGNIYAYTYDSNHNMTSITYADKSRTVMTYHPKTLFVKSILDQSGEKTDYDYYTIPKEQLVGIKTLDGDPVDDKHGTKVTKNGFDGKPVENTYDYEIATTPTGGRYTSWTKTAVNGIGTETHYARGGNLPLKITRGSNWTTFRYNSGGLLTERRTSKGEFSQISYTAAQKISRVANNAGITTFTYDPVGNLTSATMGAKTVRLNYNARNQINEMIAPDYTLSFVYNVLNKPIEIKMEGVGSMRVNYDSQGEITNVDSEAGHQMALKVTRAFQDLLSLVKPAGVNLNM